MFARHCLVAALSLVCVLSLASSPLRAADKPDRIIVSGASGQLGELTVKELLRRGVDPKNLILVSHTPQKLAEYVKRGATVRYGDLYKPETLEGAYAGGTRMLLISTGGPNPSPRPLAHKSGFDAAVKAGVKHIVYTSFLGADKAETPLIADHQQSENYLKASGAKWTVLRNGYYADLHLSAAIAMAETGRAMVPANQQKKTAPVMRADCAAAAAGALLNPSLSENQTFDITGPELYDRRDVVKAVSTMTGKKIEVTEEAPQPVGAAPGSADTPGGPAAPGTPFIPLGPPAGTPSVVSNAVAKLSGRPAMGLRVMLEANKKQILAAANGPSNDSAEKTGAAHK